jgi:serine/threonine-protein kinase
MTTNGGSGFRQIAQKISPCKGSQTLTTTGIIAGSPLYMSPEQVRGDVVDARSDLFA